MEVDELVEVIRRGAIPRPNPVFKRGLTRDPADDYLLALAQASQVDFLVFGDQDVTTLVAADSPVVTCAGFLALRF